MTTPSAQFGGQPFELDVQECRRLLVAGEVGRVAVSAPDGPHIIPVNYRVVDDNIVFRTSPYSVLGSHAKGAVLAFEVDQFDYQEQRGWSVVARGRAEAVTSAHTVKRIRDVGEPQVWAAGERHLYLAMPWSELTGRRLGRGWEPTVPSPTPAQ